MSFSQETRMVNINGIRIYTSVRRGDGTGPALLLINGVGVDLEVFDPFLDELENVAGRRIETICFDVPGAGRSPTPLFPLPFYGLAYLIARMLDMLGYRSVDMLGLSWGGGLAQQFALSYPYRCRRLVLVATSTGAISIPGRLDIITQLLSPPRYSDPPSMARIAASLYGGSSEEARELVSTYAQLVKASNRLGYYWQLLAGFSWTSISWLHLIGQPTLVLAGDDDPIVPLANAKLLAARIPHAKLYIIKGGHLFLLTEAEQVAPIVHRFLTREQLNSA
jgi:poly(3-hydroxyalkanoate) depolymerase